MDPLAIIFHEFTCIQVIPGRHLFFVTLEQLIILGYLIDVLARLHRVDPYAVFNAALERGFGKFSLYIKVENLLNKEYWTEPGWPMKARTISAGARFFLEGKK